jgi:putative endonuclease
MYQLFVYILASRSHRLYTGVTNNLETRVLQHRKCEVTFTARYRINRLVYYERIAPPIAAIQREKQIKGWVRSKKIALIESVNPKWEDLAAEWFDDAEPTADPSLRSG